MHYNINNNDNYNEDNVKLMVAGEISLSFYNMDYIIIKEGVKNVNEVFDDQYQNF